MVVATRQFQQSSLRSDADTTHAPGLTSAALSETTERTMIEHLNEKWIVFFAIPQDSIDWQLNRFLTHREAFEDFLADKRCGLRCSAFEGLNAAMDVHDLLLVASLRHRDPDYIPEHAHWLADWSAAMITGDAQMLAVNKGRLGKIYALTDAIRRREGIGPMDDWMLGEGPADYQVLVRESERLLNRIGDAVLPMVLRRYRLDDTANLFERDRRTYDLRVEIGRRISGGTLADPQQDAWHDDRLVQQYGPDGLRHVQERVAEIQSMAPVS